MSVLRPLYFPKHSDINQWTQVSTLSTHYLSKPKLFQGILLIRSPDQVEAIHSVVLTSSYLSYRTSQNLHIFNIKWSVIDAFIDETSETKRFGFTIKLTEGKNFEFFTESSEDLDLWLDHLGALTFLSNFDSNFMLVKRIQKRTHFDFLLGHSLLSQGNFLVKRIPLTSLSSIETKNLVFNEISVLRKLIHPSIARLVKSFEESDYLYLVLESSHFTSLDSLLGTKFNELDLMRFTKTLLELLCFVHSNGIILRNLTLENIFVSDVLSQFKVSDLSGSCIIGKHRKQSFVEASPCKAGPCKGSSIKTDVFSVGVILFQLAAGLRVKDCKSRKKIEKGIWSTSIEKCGINQAGKYFLNELLNEDPHLRPTAEDALKYAWFDQVSNLSKRVSRCESKKISEGSTASKLTMKYET